jgi:hypothetical protein
VPTSLLGEGVVVSQSPKAGLLNKNSCLAPDGVKDLWTSRDLGRKVKIILYQRADKCMNDH